MVLLTLSGGDASAESNDCDHFTKKDAIRVLGATAVRVSRTASACTYVSSLGRVTVGRGPGSDFQFVSNPKQYAQRIDARGADRTTVGGTPGWFMAKDPDDCRIALYTDGYAVLVTHPTGPFVCKQLVKQATLRALRVLR
jgi:hypothetical protein